MAPPDKTTEKKPVAKISTRFSDEDRSRWLQQTLERYQGRLIRYAQQILGDTERAQDVVQDTFLKLWKSDP